jgi:hypothetical protein
MILLFLEKVALDEADEEEEIDLQPNRQQSLIAVSSSARPPQGFRTRTT